jgi:phosphatidylglycerol lysyltransferase
VLSTNASLPRAVPASASQADRDRQRVLALLREHGWNATSFQILEPAFQYWFEGDGCVAFVDTGHAWVAAGAPIAADADVARLAAGFTARAREARRSAVFFATEDRFQAHGQGFAHLLIGEQPVWDPRYWPERLKQSTSLREQLRRARAKGVQIELVPAHAVSDVEAPLRRELEALIAHWLRSKPMPPMGFLVRVDPFHCAEERRLFVARARGGELVGLAAVAPVYARGGWFVENLIRSPRAPNGTMELLVDAAFRDAFARGSAYLTLGLSPLMGSVAFSLHWARRYGSVLYDFQGLRAFKAKFHPDSWASIYLSFPKDQSAFLAVYHSLSAFARRGLLQYGIETLLWGPDIVLRALALLLVPWTLLLASLDADRWFPAAWVKWAWVVFDLVLCGALLSLSLRFRRWLSALLVGLVASDALLTSLEAMLFNVPKIRRASDLIGVAVGVLAPLMATVILFNAHRRATLNEPG